MSRKLIPAVSALAFVFSSATLAQEQPAKTAPVAAQPVPLSQGGRDAGANFIPVQAKGDVLVSEWQGLTVKNVAGDSLGSVKDVAINGQGNVSAIVLGIGGFLGIGERAVAVPFEAIQLTNDPDGKQVVLVRATKAQFESAPRYVTVKTQRSAEESRKDSPPQSQRGTEPPPLPNAVKK